MSDVPPGFEIRPLDMVEEVGGRLDVRGREITQLDESDVERAAARLGKRGAKPPRIDAAIESGRPDEAIGRRLACHVAGTDHPRCTRLVLHDHGLAEHLRELLRDQSAFADW